MPVNESRAFGGVPLPDRSTKPRSQGLTMMIEWGVPLGAQADILELAAPLIDLAKVAVGISGLLPLAKLQSKVHLYRRYDVEAFPGGMYLEYAFANGVVDEYFQGCQEVGYRFVEVSDNAIPLSRHDKDSLIAEAKARGFEVLGEVGSKHAVTEAGRLVEDIQACLAAGSWKVFIEAAELFLNGKPRRDLMQRLVSDVSMADVLWELPGAWIPETHAHEIHNLEVWLIEHLGPEANIANVPTDGILSLESLRRRIGVRTLVDGQHRLPEPDPT